MMKYSKDKTLAALPGIPTPKGAADDGPRNGLLAAINTNLVLLLHCHRVQTEVLAKAISSLSIWCPHTNSTRATSRLTIGRRTLVVIKKNLTPKPLLMIVPLVLLLLIPLLIASVWVVVSVLGTGMTW